MLARAGTDAEGENSCVRGVLPGKREDRIGVRHLTVGQDDDLSRERSRRGRSSTTVNAGRISVPPRFASSVVTYWLAFARLLSLYSRLPSKRCTNVEPNATMSNRHPEIIDRRQS